jgi:ribosomal protein L29
MEIQDWVSIATLVVALSGFYAALRREFRSEMSGLRSELKSDISGLRTELKVDLAELRTELKSDLAELRTELKTDFARLDDRVYALASGLQPTLEARRHEGG